MDIDVKRRWLGLWTGVTKSPTAWCFGVAIKWRDNDCQGCGKPEVSFGFAQWRLWWLPLGPGWYSCEFKTKEAHDAVYLARKMVTETDL